MGLDHQSSSHKRYASTSELSSSQHLRAHVSQPHLGPSLTVYDHRIIELLLSDDCALLEIVCQSTFVGDTAAVVSKGVMTLLKYRNPNLAEEFLKRIFRSRAFEYISKSRDLSDIIRDNSMATMLLNAFAKSEGYGFLSISLTAPLNGIFAHLDSCEIDPSKLRMRMPGTAESDTPNSFGVPNKPGQTTTTGSGVALSMTPLSMASAGVSGSVVLQSPVRRHLRL
ncbi:hypothetical protein BC831DRAFT_166312 [Entophlyctis helioformis]|nr:hypothetical protein BC831DRAFT_166312 [Entophlyctis helioformis]